MAHLSPDRLALLRALLAEKGLSAPRARAIPRRADASRAPLSFAQERLLFLELYQPGTALYNDAVALHIEGGLDLAAFFAALGALVRRHEILRTSFALAGAGPEQRIAAEVELPIALIDLAGTPEPLAVARELARSDARTPFELESAPPWRATLVRLAKGDWLFALTMHHIASDGASMGLFFDELGAFYAAALSASQPALALPALQFGDYAAWERASFDEARAARELEYWRRALGGEREPTVWPDAGPPASPRGAQLALALAREDCERLGVLAHALGATSNQILLTAWMALLARVTGASAVRTGIASSLRTRPELEGLIGFFVQTLALQVELGGDPTFLEALRRVRATTVEALDHSALPFDRVAHALEVHDGPPLLATFFSHMKEAIRAPRLGQARVSWAFVDPGVARFELALVLHESAGEVRGFLEHDAGLFTRAAAQALADDYLALVAAALARPELRLGALPPSSARGAGHARRKAPLPFPIRRRRASGE